jgi:error-prone DNA polymerase
MRLGFRLVRGVGEPAGKAIEKARTAGLVTSVHDLFVHAGLARDEVEALAEAGALEAIAGPRRSALWLARSPRDGGLFREVPLEGSAAPPELPELAPAEQLALDYGRVGLSVDDHPMRHLRAKLARRRVTRAAELEIVKHGTRVRVAGLVVGRQRPMTASGITFVTLEDETGMANLIVRKDTFEKFHAIAQHSTFLLASGRLEREGAAGKGEGSVIHVLVDKLERLDWGAEEFPGRSRDYR